MQKLFKKRTTSNSVTYLVDEWDQNDRLPVLIFPVEVGHEILRIESDDRRLLILHEPVVRSRDVAFAKFNKWNKTDYYAVKGQELGSCRSLPSGGKDCQQLLERQKRA